MRISRVHHEHGMHWFRICDEWLSKVQKLNSKSLFDKMKRRYDTRKNVNFRTMVMDVNALKMSELVSMKTSVQSHLAERRTRTANC